MDGANALGKVTGEARIALVTPKYGTGERKETKSDALQTFRETPIQPGTLGEYLTKHFQNYEQTKCNINAIDVPIDAGVSRAKIEIGDQNRCVGTQKPDRICEEERVLTPQILAE